MKKIFFLLLISGLFFCSVGFSEPYYFKECKITNAVTGNYVLNFNKCVEFQLSYTELFFTNTLWPDITKEEITDIFEKFKSIQRKYGL